MLVFLSCIVMILVLIFIPFSSLNVQVPQMNDSFDQEENQYYD
jgi:hypothetical protein